MRRISGCYLWTAGWLGLLSLVAVGCSRGESLLDGLQSRDAVVVAQTKDKILALDAGEQVRLCLEGMQLADKEAATWCALRLAGDRSKWREPWRMLGNNEAPRFLELMWNAIGEPEGDLAFDEFRSLLGSSEMQPYLDRLEQLPQEAVKHETILGQLHRQLRPEHIPFLCKLILGEDLKLVDGAYGNLTLMLDYCDHPRELIARTLLQRPARGSQQEENNEYGSGPVALPELRDEPGYPPLLRACLEVYFEGNDVAIPRSSFIRKWLVRWVRASAPGAADRDLLLNLLQYDSYFMPFAALQGLRKLGDRSCIQPIEAWAKTIDERWRDEQSSARATLASLGSGKARDWLVRRAKDDPFAIMLLLDLEPEIGQRLAKGWMTHADAKSAAQLLELPDSPLLHLYGLTPDPARQLAWLEPLLLGQNLSRSVAVTAVNVQPWFRTRRILEAICAIPHWMEEDREDWGEGPDIQIFCAILETSSRDLLLRFAKGLFRTDFRDQAWLALLKLGAPELSDFVLVGWHQWKDYGLGDLDRPRIYLGRTPSRRILSYLRDEALHSTEQAVRQEAVEALAVAQGIPPQVGWLGGDLKLSEQRLDQLRNLVFQGKAIEALLTWVQWAEDRSWFDYTVGSIKDPRITKLLLSMREEREHQDYPEITHALALQGHQPAVAEVEAIFRTGRYRWIDEAPRTVFLPGGKLDLVPFWISELESNCCRVNPINAMFEKLFDKHFRDLANQEGNTQAFLARQWWKQAEGRLHYSRILDRYVIGVREE